MKIAERLKTVKVGENMVYSLVWIAILLIPILNAQLMSEKYIDFNKVIISWGKIAPYFLIFIVNNNIPILATAVRTFVGYTLKCAIAFCVNIHNYVHSSVRKNCS